MYLKGDHDVDSHIDDLVENEPIGPVIDSPQCFRADLRVGTTTHGLPVNYFTISLPNMDPVLHPGIKWGSMGTDNIEVLLSTDEEAVCLKSCHTENLLLGVHQHMHLSQSSSGKHLCSNNEDFLGTNLSAGRMSDTESMSSDYYDANKVDLQEHINFLCDADSNITAGCCKDKDAYHLFLSRFKELCSMTGNTSAKLGVMKKGLDLIEVSLLQMSLRTSNYTSKKTEGVVSSPRALNNQKHSVQLGRSPRHKCRRKH